MGLLGGFKGKLIGARVKKDKSKDTVIVCTKFHRFSEFDAPPSNLPTSSRSDVTNGGPAARDVFERVRVNGTVNKGAAAPEPTKPIVTPTKATPQPPKRTPAPTRANKPSPVPTGASPAPSTQKRQAPRAPAAVSFESDDEDDDNGNFKIHIAKNRDGASEIESDAESWDGNSTRSSPPAYSSQAASIFFGEDEAPEVTRPRNLLLNEVNEDSDSSSASA